jgi:hypothetical protein
LLLLFLPQSGVIPIVCFSKAWIYANNIIPPIHAFFSPCITVEHVALAYVVHIVEFSLHKHTFGINNVHAWHVPHERQVWRGRVGSGPSTVVDVGNLMRGEGGT